jgi:hypothetical protein
MHGFTSNVLSCEERERLAQELFETALREAAICPGCAI